MPAKTTLAAIQSAIQIETVKSQLDAYAISIFVYELKKYRQEKNEVKKQLQSMDCSIIEIESLRAKSLEFERQPHLGFYYTIALFDQLSDTHPNEAKQMIEAVLSFDTMGRYLLEEGPIVLDGKPFVLDEILSKFSIDGCALKAAAKLNQSNTAYIHEEVRQAASIAPKRSPFALPANIDTFEQSKSAAFRQLKRFADNVRTCESIRKKVALLPIDFSLLSQAATEESVREFLFIVAELFFHAKTQDSSKLDILNIKCPRDGALNDYSTVAFLQNALDVWMRFSLVLAPTTAIFDQRMRFIMAVFSEANKTLPALPSIANADMYFPLFVFSSVMMKSVLQFHPSVTPNLVKLREMCEQHNISGITKYMNDIKLSIEGEAVPLSPMRMVMTSQLELSKEYAELQKEDAKRRGGLSPESIANAVIVHGKVVYSYFKPAQHKHSDLNKMSDKTRTLLSALSQAYVFDEDIDFYDTINLLVSSFAIHKPNEIVAKQLQLLEYALLLDHPRIYFRQKRLFSSKPGKLVCLEDADALQMIAKQVKRLLKETQKLKRELPEYKIALTQWGNAILERVKQLTSLAQNDPETEGVRERSGATYLRRMSIFRYRAACRSPEEVVATPGKKSMHNNSI